MRSLPSLRTVPPSVYISQDGDTGDVTAVVDGFRDALRASVPEVAFRHVVHIQVRWGTVVGVRRGQLVLAGVHAGMHGRGGGGRRGLCVLCSGKRVVTACGCV